MINCLYDQYGFAVTCAEPITTARFAGYERQGIAMAEPMFAKAGRGYDRAQVDAFLLELNRSFAEKESALNDRIRELTASLADITEKLQLCESEKRAAETAFAEQLAEKEKECAAMHASIGQRMMAADTRAEEIIASAQAQANTILENARRRAEHETERIVTETRRSCAVIGQAAAEFSGRMNAVAAEMRKTEALLDNALEEVKRRSGMKKT